MQVQFYVVYIREAHALDGRSPLGGGRMPIVEEPVTLKERSQVAAVCMTRLALEPMPALVDTMDDTVSKDYAAHPDRLYLVGRVDKRSPKEYNHRDSGPPLQVRQV